MPGMPGGSAATSALTEAFKVALMRQGLVAFLIFVLLAITWVACREVVLAQARARLVTLRLDRPAEPTARRVLRIGFGVLWILDGLLQAQPLMPTGLPSDVMVPAAAGSPGWVVRLVDWASTGWIQHPVQAAAGAVWIQLGIGIWLVSASSGRWSRLAGLVSVGWGLVVWVFGEAFGSMLAPGQSWLMGAPGAALFYSVAGALLALPARYWHDARLGRRVLRGAGVLLVGFAVLQAWPGRGFWQGSLHGQPGSLASSVDSMATASQPSVLSHLVSWFGSVVAGHGLTVNLIVVVALALIGGCLLTGRLAIVRPAVLAAIAFCLADWLLVQDLGFLGGLGTDPNSMLPQAVILVTGLLAMTVSTAAVSSATASTATASSATASSPAARSPAVSSAAASTAAASSPAARSPAVSSATASSPAASGAGPPEARPEPGLPRRARARPAWVAATLTSGGAGAMAVDRLPLPGRARMITIQFARTLAIALGTAGTSAVLGLWAVAMVVMGATPMTLAVTGRSADLAGAGGPRTPAVSLAATAAPLGPATSTRGRAGVARADSPVARGLGGGRARFHPGAGL